MKFLKPPISVDEQIEILEDRGLVFNNKVEAKSYLSNISFYRLRAYTFPFQKNDDPSHPFIRTVSFDEIINLYVFDRKLRLLLFDNIEKIEIALRTQIIHRWALLHGSHWHTNVDLFNNSNKFYENNEKLTTEIKRSNETFINHYLTKYTEPEHPPSWMSLEVSSFGLLSQIFLNLKYSNQKKEIAKYFGLLKPEILENWIHCFSSVRNICAHHGRIWNRRLTTHITIPISPLNEFIQDKKVIPYKIYSVICCMQYVLNIINPQSNFKAKLKELMKECPLKQEKEMDFPQNWEQEPFWK